MTISLQTLASMLQKGVVEFTYTTKGGETKTVKGTNKQSEMPIGYTGGNDVNPHGNLVFFDLDDNGWKTVHGLSTITLPKAVGVTVSNPVANTSAGYVSSAQLVTLLANRIVKFEYITKKNDLRTAYGTLDATRSKKVAAANLPTSLQPGVDILYFDIEKDGVRNANTQTNTAFKVIEVMDLPLKD